MTEHADRLRIITIAEDNFHDNTLRTIAIASQQGITAIVGKLKTDANGTTRVQSYLFDKVKWDNERACKWVREHEGMTDALLGENTVIDLGDDGTKRLPQNRMTKMLDVELKDFNDEDRSFTAIASSESKDRDGDILRIDGWKLKNFKRNPVVLWAHRADLLPVAKAKDVWIDKKKLMITPKFMTADMNPFADQVYLAYRHGYLNSFSVRFDPVEWADIPVEQAEGKNGVEVMMRNGREYKSQELLEVSCVNIPANPDARKDPNMLDFIVKSYFYEHFDKDALTGLDLQGLFAKADATLRGKIEKYKEISDEIAKMRDFREMRKAELIIDAKIKELEAELKAEQTKSELENIFKEIHGGITALSK